jgi:ATP phosphoribosyltransferase
MNGTDRVRIAMQKKGRLSERSGELLKKCGLDFDWRPDQLVCSSTSFPLDLMLIRDDDIPHYVLDGICELGIVGQNVLEEALEGKPDGARGVTVLEKLGFGGCRLSVAVPRGESYEGPVSLEGKTLATSYPNLLRRFLANKNVKAEVVEITGSVEIAPALNIADAICDLVSTGSTLMANGLREVERVFESQAVLIQTRRPLDDAKLQLIRRIEQRIQAVSRAVGIKYVMMHAPRSALPLIKEVMPGMESPTVIPIGTDGEKVAIHAVAREPDFWATMERLKEVGASSILVSPIEKIIE